MKHRPFMQVDVFTDTPYRGNPVAVVLDADGLSDDAMQRIARWTNLSETTFVLAPTAAGADYRLRIFTPGSELPFAGHPTLGSAHALIASARLRPREGRLVQECDAGLVPVALDADGARLWLRLPPAHTALLDDAARARLERALGLACPGAMRIDVGPVWITARVDSGAALLAARPDLAAIEALSRESGATGVTVFGALDGDDARWEVRSFAPAAGVPEDPVCGSGNGCVAVFLGAAGERAPYEARQGRAIGRDGRIAVRGLGGEVEIGGACVACVRGEILA